MSRSLRSTARGARIARLVAMLIAMSIAILVAVNGALLASRIEVPMFLVHGRNDPRVPVAEAEQLARTIAQNGVPVRTLIADNEGHGFAKKENAADAFHARVRFLQRYLLGGG